MAEVWKCLAQVIGVIRERIVFQSGSQTKPTPFVVMVFSRKGGGRKVFLLVIAG
jgi:hypothetical protein